MDYETLYRLFVGSKLSYRDFYESVVIKNSPNVEFEAFRSAMRRRHAKQVDIEGTQTLQPSESALLELCDSNKAIVTDHLSKVAQSKDHITGIFISDVHIPYTDWVALDLALQIIEDVNPDYITGLNDVFDFQEYGRWDDLRSPAKRLWDSDIQNPLNAHKSYMKMLHDAGPNAIIEGLTGNHDYRMYRYLRERAVSLSDWTMKHFLSELKNQGLYVTSLNQDPVYINNNLVLVHGIAAAKNVNTTAVRTVEAYGTKQYANESGKYFNTIAGHDHRVYTIPVHGVTAYGNGCLCRTDMEYLKTPPNWQLGITVFYTNKDRAWAYPLLFQFDAGELSCIFNEKRYAVKR